MSFTITPQRVPEVLLVEHPRFSDDRGYFCETFRDNDLREHGIGPLVQDNHSRSSRGVLRGLHFQERPVALGKLVRCVRGRILDVAVDIRKSSRTYRQWVGVELTEDDNYLLWLPEGFAHGFCTISDEADVLYRQTNYYSPQHDRAIAWNDPDIAIAWPFAEPILSDKDARAPFLRDL